jgi:ABC-type phosphate transport system permease subunit
MICLGISPLLFERDQVVRNLSSAFSVSLDVTICKMHPLIWKVFFCGSSSVIPLGFKSWGDYWRYISEKNVFYGPGNTVSGAQFTTFRKMFYSLTLSWPVGHVCPTYKESFQVRWGNSIPLFLHAAIYLFRWTSQNAFSRVQMILCAMLRSMHCTQYHLYTAVSRENAFWLVQRNRYTSR